MGFRVKPKECASKGITRIARRQVEKAIRDLSEPAENPDETIHDVRKRLKRIRALLRIVRPAVGKKRYHRQNHLLRDVGRSLSEARDARVLVQTLQSLAEGTGPNAIEPILSVLHQRAETVRAEVRESPQWNALPTHLKRVRKMVKKWPLDEGADWPVLAPGIGRIYRKGYEAHSKARKNPNAETLHEWRKRVKDLWHALELLRNARPAFFERRVPQAHELADLLGDDHDLAVLDAYLDSENLPVDSEMIRSLKTRITDRRVELQRQAFLRGPMVYDESPKTYMERLEAYWHAWRAEVHARRQPTL